MSMILSGKMSGSSLPLKSYEPNPLVFQIEKCWQYRDFLLVKVNYFKCPTFEGRKLLLFKGLSFAELKCLKELDPHFFENSQLVARFPANEFGIELAHTLMKSYISFLEKDDKEVKTLL